MDRDREADAYEDAGTSRDIGADVAQDPAAADGEVLDLSAIDTTAIADDIRTLVARMDRAGARMLILLGEFDAREGWAAWLGVRSAAHWLSWLCGIGPHAAREQVRVARALRTLPRLRQEYADGRLSYAKVRATTRIATRDTEDDLVDLALSTTAAQLDRVVRGWRRVDELSVTDAAEQLERQRLQWWWDEGGMLVLHGRIAPDGGALLVAALTQIQAKNDLIPDDPTHDRPVLDASSASTPPRRATDSAEPPTLPLSPRRGLSDVAALVELARRFGDPHDAGPGGTTQVVLHVDTAVLAADAAAGLAALESGARLSPEEARRLCCDATLVTLLTDSAGNPGDRAGVAGRRDVLDVGRTTRSVSKQLRLALIARDGGCTYPGCPETRTYRLHAHHVRHWARGGPTALANLALLCAFHHSVIHHTGVTMALKADGFIFADPDGHSLHNDPWREVAARQTDPDLSEIDVDPDTIPTWLGERFDLRHILDTLCEIRAWRRAQRHATHPTDPDDDVDDVDETREAA